MTDSNWTDRPLPQQGALDIQLPIPHSVETTPDRLKTIRKRDGREATFDTTKIAEAIFQAAKSIGGDDQTLSQSLAASVSIFLSNQRRNEPLSVSHVDDAVERVLVEMGHERTALAYVQHRSNRRTDDGLSVQDSRSVRDALMEWRWNRTATAARPADELESAIAELNLSVSDRKSLHTAVRETLTSLPAQTTTAALIHELVRAHANVAPDQDARQLHLNLSHLEEAISGTSKHPLELMTPESSDKAIAQRVKEAYALNRLYSPDVTNAHIRGDIHIHGLEQSDRLDSLTLYPDVIKKFGSILRWTDTDSPARRIEFLLEDIAESTQIFRQYCSHFVQWESINYALAPYLVEFDDVHLHSVSKQLIDSFVQLGDDAATIKLHISWDVPNDLQGIDAMGPNGANTGKPYESYQKTAQDFAHILLQTLRESAIDAHAPKPLLAVVSPPAPGPRDEATVAYLNRIALCGLVLDSIEYRCDADTPMLPFEEQTVHPKSIVVQAVTMNLPRLGRAAQDGHHFWTALDHLFDICASALDEKRRFVSELARRKKNGPYSYLTIQHHAQPFADIERSSVQMCICGLPECAQALQQIAEFDGQSLSAIKETIVAHLYERREAWAAQSSSPLLLSPSRSHSVAARFTGIDREHFASLSSKDRYSIGLSSMSESPVPYRDFEKQIATAARYQSSISGSVPIQRPDSDITFPEQLSHTLEDYFKSQPNVTLRLMG